MEYVDVNSSPVKSARDFKNCVSYLMKLKFSQCHEDITDFCNQTDDDIENDKQRSDISSLSFSSEAQSLCRPIPDSMPLALSEDPIWLSEFHCFLRSECCEFFRAESTHSTGSLRKIPTLTNYRMRLPVSEGRVGIRCRFCGVAPYHKRAAQAISFPSSICGIYSAVCMMQVRHFPLCKMIPDQVFTKLTDLKRGTSSASSWDKQSGGHVSGRQQYWVDCAKKMGLVDTLDGIRFASDVIHIDQEQTTDEYRVGETYENENELQSYFFPSNKSKRARFTYHLDHTLDSPKRKTFQHEVLNSTRRVPTVSPCPDQAEIKIHGALDRKRIEILSSLILPNDLVLLEDIDLVPDYLMIAMGQMKPCILEEWDKVGCYRNRPTGFRGMCCKHCGGENGHGKFFPSTVGGLSQTTTAQTILKHVAFKCPQCPDDVRQAVLKFQEDQSLSDATNRQIKGPKYGSRKFFFQRLWDRLHDLDANKISSTPERGSPQSSRHLASLCTDSSSPLSDISWNRSSTCCSISDDDSAVELNVSVTV